VRRLFSQAFALLALTASCATGGSSAPGKGNDPRPASPLDASASDASTSGLDASSVTALGFVELGNSRVMLEGPLGDAGEVTTSVDLGRPRAAACLRVAFASTARLEARLVTSGVLRSSVTAQNGLLGPEGPVCVGADDRVVLMLSGPRAAEVSLAWFAPKADPKPSPVAR
jgi:hypothetical protein